MLEKLKSFGEKVTAENLKTTGKVLLAGAIGLEAVNLAIPNSVGRFKPEQLRMRDLSAEVAPDRPPLPMEVLRPEYEKLRQEPNLGHTLAASRIKVNRIANFGIQIAPGVISTKMEDHKDLTIEDLEAAGIQMGTFTPMVDLTAFNVRLLRTGGINLKNLSEKGIKEIVIMEDRDPQMGLNYNGYKADEVVPLSRHAKDENHKAWKMEDLKDLVEQLREANIRVIIGFWLNAGNADKNEFIRKNWATVKPVIESSDDLNPLSIVNDQQGKEMPFADYIVRQYEKLEKDFGFSGLYLGDGAMGYRSFLEPEQPNDFSATKHLWTDFFKRIHQGVKAIDPNDTLWAYDCLGKGPKDALRHGVDVKAILPYLDGGYAFQSYSRSAWGDNFMNLPGYTAERDQAQIQDLSGDVGYNKGENNNLVPPHLAHVKYTVNIKDNVEGWHSNKQIVAADQKTLGPNAPGGTVGIWSNAIVSQMLKAK